MAEALPRALRRTLVMVAQAMHGARDDWWVIGSAAVALHGGAPIAVADVDILASETDARRVTDALGIAAAPGLADALFGSAIFATWRAPPLPVEFMAGFAVRSGDVWTPVTLQTRETVTLDGYPIPVPGRDELRDLLHAFGRPKDLQRAVLLR